MKTSRRSWLFDYESTTAWTLAESGTEDSSKRPIPRCSKERLWRIGSWSRKMSPTEKLARSRELHSGIVLLEAGDLRRDEQLEIVRRAIQHIEAAGADMVNRVLRVAEDGSMAFEEIPTSATT